MYKTVRKGDASLQYTILPQTDQFSSSGFPQTASKSRPRIIKYTMGTLMILIILSCVATPFLMNQDDQSLFASSILAMGRVGHNTISKNSSRSQGENASMNRSRSRLMGTISLSTEAPKKQDAQDVTTSSSKALKTEAETENFTTTDSGMSSPQRLRVSSDLLAGLQQTSTFATLLSSSSSTSPFTTSTLLPSISSEVTASDSSVSRKENMSKVSLKFRENETIPQRYIKPGIASYKKANITTSILAHGLTLEGLIFKTPEGTIKPWPHKWFFTDPSADFQWKGLIQIPVTIYIVLAGLAAFASGSIVLMFYMQRKTSRRQRQSVKEPEAGDQEEDKSTLLGAESQEIEEKE